MSFFSLVKESKSEQNNIIGQFLYALVYILNLPVCFEWLNFRVGEDFAFIKIMA
jgi:hypothetical protein